MKQSFKAPNQPIRSITLKVTEDFQTVRDLLTKNSSSNMTYNQTVAHLCHFYLIQTQQTNKPCTVWRHPQ